MEVVLRFDAFVVTEQFDERGIEKLGAGEHEMPEVGGDEGG